MTLSAFSHTCAAFLTSCILKEAAAEKEKKKQKNSQVCRLIFFFPYILHLVSAVDQIQR